MPESFNFSSALSGGVAIEIILIHIFLRQQMDPQMVWSTEGPEERKTSSLLTP